MVRSLFLTACLKSTVLARWAGWDAPAQPRDGACHHDLVFVSVAPNSRR